MIDDIEKRATELAEYIIDHECTVRAAAKKFELGKSTVHKDVTDRLKDIDPSLYDKVRKVLDYNLSVRHLRGGEATRRKCAEKAEKRFTPKT